MNDTGYSVTFAGEIQQGEDLPEVKANLARVLKLDAATADKLFTGKTIVIKRGLDEDGARRFKAVFDRCGAICEISPRLFERRARPREESNASPDAIQLPPSDIAFCRACGEKIGSKDESCPACGTRQIIATPRNRFVAGALAICFGWLGLHRFYLGQISGVVYLFLTFLAWPIAIIEGLVFMLTPEEKWLKKYGAVPAVGMGVGVSLVLGVVVLIGLIAAVAIPAYQEYIDTAEELRAAAGTTDSGAAEDSEAVQVTPEAAEEKADYLPAQNVTSDLNYSINLAGSDWQRWPEFNEEQKHVHEGARIDDHSKFWFSAYCYDGLKPSGDAASSSVLDAHTMDYASDNWQAIQPGVVQGDLEARLLFVDNEKRDVLSAIAYGQHCAYVTTFWSSLEGEAFMKTSRELFGRIVLRDEIVSSAALQHHQAKHQGYFENHAGIYYYEQDNYTAAIDMFEKALKLNTSTTYLLNAVRSANEVDQYERGLALIEGFPDQAALDSDLLSWRAWFSYKTGDHDTARTRYAAVFAAGYRAEDELLVYADLLAEVERYDEASVALEQFAESETIDIARKKVSMFRLQEKYEEATTLLDKLAATFPQANLDLVYDRIRLLRDQNKQDEIVTLTTQMIAEGQENARIYYEKGRAEYLLSSYVEASESLEQALVYSPGNKTILDYLTDVRAQLGQSDTSEIAREITAVPLPDLAQAEARDITDFDAYYLHRSTAIFFRQGERLKTTQRRYIKVVNQAGARRFNTMTESYDPLYERAYINSLRVLNEQGEVVAEASREDAYITDEESDMADSGKEIHMPVPNLKPGYTIEYTVTTETLWPKNELPFETIFLSSGRPVGQSAVSVTGDIDLVAYKQFAIDLPVVAGDTLLWQQNWPQVYKSEPLRIPIIDYLPSVTMSHKGQVWSDIGTEYLARIDDKLIDEPEILALAERVTASTEDPREKAALLIRYVQDNITYKAIEFGTRGQIPNTALQTINNRYGDCKDHSVLLYKLFEAVGLDAQLVLVNLGTQIDDGLPSLDQFNHMIVKLNSDDESWFIDGTDKSMMLMERPPGSLAGESGLVLAAEPQLQQLPRYPGNATSLEIHRQVTIDVSGQSHVKEKLAFDSYIEGRMRRRIKSVEGNKRFDWLQGFVTDIRDDISLISFEVSDPLELSDTLSMDIQYSIEGNPALANLAYEAPAIWEKYYAVPAQSVDRATDFELAEPLLIKSYVDISFPPGFEPESVNESVKTPFGHYYLKSERKTTNSLRVEFEYFERAGRFDAEQYDEYFEFTRAAVSMVGVPLKQKAGGP